ncbi:ABC transporter G family member 28-like isoform X2 [Asparagus officinalis]|uniref:ABC transporter G family member 28-like isoform X2 n=1 Tax=Asparagus officinalis TaxID=4686 RepID=UPI00098DFE05|nr:ABC transporter G family member 28-like isoform X2 [Asparagus officinalis]
MRTGAGQILLRLLLFLSINGVMVRGQDDDDPSSSTGLQSYYSRILFSRIMNLTEKFKPQINRELGYCIKDPDQEINAAFNFSKDPTFLTNCLRENRDLSKRLCTAAEVKLYFNSFLQNEVQKFVRPNKNCNLTSWVSGCEPGWACSVGKDVKVDLKDDKKIPTRTHNCSACCEGFFCPQGLTCMIPCPLGAYCPLATLNKTTGICDPYNYQLPPGQTNHSCGSADRWADVLSSDEVFCPAGYYCPTTIQKISCSRGHYCRKGSTAQNKCFNKGSCKPNSTNQNITVFGVLLVVGLSLLLLIIYNFSGQVLTNRERKQAKSRENAARVARETAQARERWKSARDVAKKSAIGLQSQLSRTFSRKQAPSPTPPTAPQQSSKASTTKSKETSDLIKMMHSLDENPDNEMGLNLKIGDKNLKKNAPKGKQMHTRSQIFKYAYGQIEKEKAMQQQNKNLSFTGVISMATDDDIRTRPVMEVAFKDLTLTLKRNGKKILRSVTGKLMPGRVAALMGPSGAGKTTYLSAVSGKVTGCEASGLVLINGKLEPIQAYRKIIGFVPQDDIVHGNLTVEENLWFSAKCRLSADLSKADKVLVVERVIESLGLQAIRDSLVGTVEKRGISGGQRKRVNVGLEMVMEPSLLILDEPTSGLDSSSSQLLLRALRREALEGVNICAVVHQPSYALFKMFDDLILLAKGGITVYHGSVKKVEEYFAGLGINVPERVNPPDYFIDILEGITKPPGINVKQLPLKWMTHNGYEIPQDMFELARSDDTLESVGEGSTSGGLADDPSISSGELGDIKVVNELPRDDNLERSFSKASDLSNRRTPGVLRQYRYFLGRVGKQRLREARIQGVDYLILGLAGVCLGTLAKMTDETFGALGYTYTVIAVCTLVYGL